MSFGSGGFGGFGSTNNQQQSTGFGGFGNSNNTSTGMSYFALLQTRHRAQDSLQDWQSWHSHEHLTYTTSLQDSVRRTILVASEAPRTRRAVVSSAAVARLVSEVLEVCRYAFLDRSLALAGRFTLRLSLITPSPSTSGIPCLLVI
jgi:hypothetical protein